MPTAPSRYLNARVFFNAVRLAAKPASGKPLGHRVSRPCAKSTLPFGKVRPRPCKLAVLSQGQSPRLYVMQNAASLFGRGR